MARSNVSLKTIGFNYKFSRDGGAVGVIDTGIKVLANRLYNYFGGYLFTEPGLTGGLLTTVSLGTPTVPSYFMSEPIATFAPRRVLNMGPQDITLTESVIITIANEEITSGTFIGYFIFSEFPTF